MVSPFSPVSPPECTIPSTPPFSTQSSHPADCASSRRRRSRSPFPWECAQTCPGSPPPHRATVRVVYSSVGSPFSLLRRMTLHFELSPCSRLAMNCALHKCMPSSLARTRPLSARFSCLHAVLTSLWRCFAVDDRSDQIPCLLTVDIESGPMSASGYIRALRYISNSIDMS